MKYLGPKSDPEDLATQGDVTGGGGAPLSNAAPDEITPDQTGAAGTSGDAARADHVHAINAAAPSSNLTASTTNAEGSSTSFSRADHSHALTTGTPGAIQPDDTASAGSSANLARADHRHSIVAAAPSANLTASTTNAEGTATSFARSDHSHAITTGTPGTITPDDAAAAGTSASLARADHVHAITTAAPPSSINGVSNAEGSATSFARSDHTHQISLPRCRAIRNTTQSIGNASTTVVDLTSEEIDTDGFHSNSTNPSRITIPNGLSGDYLITAIAVFASNATGYRQLVLYLNGAGAGNLDGVTNAAVSGGVTTRLSFAGLFTLTSTDYVEAAVFQNSGGSLNITNASLQIVRVG